MVALFRSSTGRNRPRWSCLLALGVVAMIAATVGTASAVPVGVVSADAAPEGVHRPVGDVSIPTQSGPAMAVFGDLWDDLVDSVGVYLVGAKQTPWLLVLHCITVVVDWADCAIAYTLGELASDSSVERFPESIHNGKGDAFRHCTWAAWTTIGVDGRPSARLITELYELNFSAGIEKEMDRFNNNFGHTVGELAILHHGGAAIAKQNGLNLYDHTEWVCHWLACDEALSTISYHLDEPGVCPPPDYNADSSLSAGGF